MNHLLIELTRPYPAKYVQKVRDNDYVAHHIVEQRLIHIFGVPPKTELLREIYDEGKLTGCVMRMTIPGHSEFWAEEAGASDNPQSKTNADRLKDACSDAYKRCAMRIGNGLHLWAGDHYFLHDALTKTSAPNGHGAQGDPATVQPPEAGPHETPVGSGTEPVEQQQEKQGEETPQGEGSPPADPGLTAKRIRFKELCRKGGMKLVPEKVAFDAFKKNLSDLTEEELDELIGAQTGKVAS